MKRRARRIVDNLHVVTGRMPDPVRYLRVAQELAEKSYAETGDKLELEIARALGRSLDGES